MHSGPAPITCPARLLNRPPALPFPSHQDEADEMLSRGFKDQIYDIFQLLPPKIQVRAGG